MNSGSSLAVITSRLRVEEKLIFTALGERGIPFDRVDDAQLRLEAGHPSPSPWPFVWNRSLSFGRTLYACLLYTSPSPRDS